MKMVHARGKRKDWPILRPLPGGKVQVDLGRTFGKRIQRRFPDRASALEWVEEKKAELQNLGTEAAVLLTAAAKRDAVEALRVLNGQGSLREAAEFYTRHATIAGGTVTVQEVINLFLNAKRAANRRYETIRGYRLRLGKFCQAFGDWKIQDVTSRDIERWLARPDWSDISKSNYLGAISVFMNFARRRGLLITNPAAALDKPSSDDRLPAILTLNETRSLMRAAESNAKWHPLIPYLSISLFAGLRPGEICQCGIENINVQDRWIRVLPATAKRRRQRLVDIADNLAAWLQAYPPDRSPIYYSRKYLDQVRKHAHVRWANDILRHTYVSNHMAYHEDAARTALQAGHLRLDVLFNHYRNLVTKADASDFWRVMPSAAADVVNLLVATV